MRPLCSSVDNCSGFGIQFFGIFQMTLEELDMTYTKVVVEIPVSVLVIERQYWWFNMIHLR